MASPKKSKKAPTPPSPGADAEPADVPVISETALKATQKVLLSRVSRFLVNVQSARFSGRAAREGYRPEAHAEGWALWNKAAGSDRPLDHWFTEQAHAADLGNIAADRLRLLQEIDAFENRWFPRLRMIIRRVIPRGRRDAFAAGFFQNLVQEPLGPGVVGSVRALLLRIEGLATSTEPGAKKVFATVRERGLTADKINEVRLLLKKAEEGAPATVKKMAVSAADLAKAQAEQQAAFEDLKDWFNDWATMLRPAFNAQEQVILGLAKSVSRATTAGDVEEVDEGDEEVEGEEADSEEP